jgi:hypothetical protein
MANEIRITDALQSLKPGAGWILRGDVLEWLDAVQTEPTDAEIDAEVIRLQAEYDALQYQRDREPDYPNLAEQFDLLWHAIDADTLDKTSDFYTTLKAVKDAHPKG